jgi:hypothetical protein
MPDADILTIPNMGQDVNIWYNMLMMKSADVLFVNTDHMLLFISVVLAPMFVT